MSMRRRAREIALQVLYQQDVQPDIGADVALGRFYASFSEDAAGSNAEIAGEVREHAGRLVRGVAERLAEVDGAITNASRNWRLERMARVDRNLLRLAVYEMRFCDDVPDKVAINEAIEVAKRYGALETPSFVNGILDRVLAGG